MEKAWRLLKRGFAATFGGSTQQKLNTSNTAPADTTNPVEPARIITVEHNSKRCNALLLPNALLAAWRSICQQNRQMIAARQQVAVREALLEDYLAYAHREQRRLHDLPATHDAAVDDAVARRKGEVGDGILQARGIKEEDRGMLEDLEAGLEETVRLANGFVEDALVAGGILASRDEFDFGFHVPPDEVFWERFVAPVKEEARRRSARG